MPLEACASPKARAPSATGITSTTWGDMLETTGTNYMVLSFQFGNLSHAQAMRSIRLFRQHLMPQYGIKDPFRFSQAAAS